MKRFLSLLALLILVPFVHAEGFLEDTYTEVSLTEEAEIIEEATETVDSSEVEIQTETEQDTSTTETETEFIAPETTEETSPENEASWFFIDLPNDNAYAPAIEFMSSKNYMTGYSDGTIRVDNPVSRVEALKMILAASEIDVRRNTRNNLTPELEAPEDELEILEEITLELESAEEVITTEETAPLFPDTDPNQWYYPFLETAVDMGIVSGHDDGNFKPTDTVTMAEALKMLLEANQRRIVHLPNKEWYSGYFSYAIQHRITVPNSEGEQEPEKVLTRGDLANLIYRYKVKPFTGEYEYGIASYYADYFHGRTTASGVPFDMNNPKMAAHKTLPFNTWVRVTNLNNNKYIDVEILDRGPYIDGRIIDLSKGGFEEIGHLGSGILNVRIEVLQ